ncbi:M23 family metallopeptidase [Prauserella alba]|uniref:M23ase beta-sheet core domain-containing protein n=1 Tax=Prauserella alba TaxID=176898 RepID=A0ABN1VF66_9PSEU|nr:M23 family metallopeptidase [Prauserella alba]
MKTFGRIVLLGAVVGAVAYAQHHLPTAPGPGAEANAAPRFAAPAEGAVTSEFGPRWGTQHYGLDIGAPHGTPIRAAADGKVVEAGPATGFGNWVRIKHPSGDVTVYGHMARYRVTAGDRVRGGERIAAVGSEGQSTGPHLHFEVWPDGQRANRTDPRDWLTARGIHL